MELKNELPDPKKKKEKRYEVPKNGEIIVNSIIGKL